MSPRRKYVGGFGTVICPKCEARGTLYCYLVDQSGPYWHVIHLRVDFKSEKISEEQYVWTRKHISNKTCYLGKLTDEELDELLTRRPWPLTAVEALEIIKKKD